MLRRLYMCCALALVLVLTTTVASAEITTYYGLGDGYAGKIMADGSPMDPSAFTAAHPYLPFGTTVTVCWDGCVDVVITDRGPTLDLTPAAAGAIGILDAGRVDAPMYVH